MTFIKSFFLTCLLLLSPLLLSWKLLWNLSEIKDFNTITMEQKGSDGVYLSGLNGGSFFKYKFTMATLQKPEIIVLGSSTTMQFRSTLFKNAFYNAGGAANSMWEAKEFLEKLFPIHKPKFIILGLDAWWFNPNWNEPRKTRNSSYGGYASETDLSISRINSALKMMSSNELFERGFLNLVFSDTLFHPKYGFRAFGIQALGAGAGFRTDGSMFYGRRLELTDHSHPDYLFKDTLLRVSEGDRRFEYGNSIDNERFEILRELIDFVKTEGVELAIFIPPLAPSVYSSIMNNLSKYQYLQVLKERLSSLDVKTNWLLDAGLIKSDDCEFIDGVHGGEVTMARTALQMSDSNPALSEYMSTMEIQDIVNNNSGRVLVGKFIPKNFKETDFLGLGCDKK